MELYKLSQIVFTLLDQIFIYVSAARDEKPPKVIMTSKSFNSVTLSFDHFAPKGYKHRYVAMVSRKIYLNQTYNLQPFIVFEFWLIISINIF